MAQNKVVDGAYFGGSVKLSGRKDVKIRTSMLNILLTDNNVESYELVDGNYQGNAVDTDSTTHFILIKFKGRKEKISLLEVDEEIYRRISQKFTIRRDMPKKQVTEPEYEPNPAPTQAPSNEAMPPSYVIDEITKFKKLLDDGALTQEEFDAIKRRLINM